LQTIADWRKGRNDWEISIPLKMNLQTPTYPFMGSGSCSTTDGFGYRHIVLGTEVQI